MDQELPLQGLKWLVPPYVGWAQFLMTQLLQKTLVGLDFTLAMVGVAPV
jgi:hypothetical protein